MHGPLEPVFGGADADPASQGRRLVRCQAGRQLRHARMQVAAQRLQGQAQQTFHGNAEQGLRVRAGLHHHQRGFLHGQQHPMGLHRAREMDELALAIAEVRLTEGRAGRH